MDIVGRDAELEIVGRFLDEADRPISDAERAQARTMLTLCDDLGQLTRERLGAPAADPEG